MILGKIKSLLLSEERHPTPFPKIYINGVIDRKSSARIIADIHELASSAYFLQQKGKWSFGNIISGNKTWDLVPMPIDIIINSPGGSSDEMFAIYDTINLYQSSGLVFRSFGFGLIASAASMLFVCANQRFVGDNAKFMLHGGAGFFGGSPNEIKEALERYDKDTEQYKNLIVANSNLTPEVVEGMMKDGKDHFFTAKEMLESGLADKATSDVRIYEYLV